jgi:dTDP-4-amino-4,6-dideoxygalactose transaminase
MALWDVPLADVIVTDDDIAVVAEVYRSGWLSMGPQTEAFEERLSTYVGARHALAVSSGTAALHLMCLAIGLGPGDEVIVPSMTFVATANAVAYTGATPVFAEIASLTQPWLSCAAAEAAITERTKAIMTMSYGGHAGDVIELQALCAKHGLILLEDAAHGLGSRIQGQYLGTLGLAGAYSFFSNKNLAVGEGGAVVTDDDELAARLRLLRSHGMTSLSWDRHRGHATGYDVTALGFNYRIDEPRAALAARRLERLDDENAERGRLVSRYRELLEGSSIDCVLPPVDGLQSANHLFCVLVEAERDEFRAQLAASKVQTSLHYPPVHEFSIYADSRAVLPTTLEYARRAATLPLFAHMTEAQQDHVVAAAIAASQTAAR